MATGDKDTDMDNNQDAWLGHTLRFERDLKGKDLLDPKARRDNVDDLLVIDPRVRRRDQAAAEEESKLHRSKRKDRSQVFQPNYKRSRH